MIAVGLGCRRGATADEVTVLVRRAMSRLSSPPSYPVVSEPTTAGLRLRAMAQTVSGAVPTARSAATVSGLFTHVAKRGEVGLIEAAALLDLPLTFLDPAVLALVAGSARSCSRRVEEMFGLPTIAETAALAGAGAGAVLLVPKLASANVTCAIAGAAPP